MPRFAANLHYLFNEVPFLDRFEASAKAGFRGVEFQVPYHWPAERLARLLRANDLELALIDTPQGDWDKGERGLAALPGREEEFREGVAKAADYAAAMGAGAVHVIAGIVPADTPPAKAADTYLNNLAYAASYLARYGILALIEPINPHHGLIEGGETYTTYGMQGFYLTSVRQAVEAIEKAGHSNLFLHLDIYHMQLTEGRLAHTLKANMPLIRHLQIGGVPGRNEPSLGEINYPYLFQLIDDLGFSGWVGCEYRPLAGTLEGLAWAAPYGISSKAVAASGLARMETPHGVR
jgi:hydroxypyruvate isomerase